MVICTSRVCTFQNVAPGARLHFKPCSSHFQSQLQHFRGSSTFCQRSMKFLRCLLLLLAWLFVYFPKHGNTCCWFFALSKTNHRFDTIVALLHAFGFHAVFFVHQKTKPTSSVFSDFKQNLRSFSTDQDRSFLRQSGQNSRVLSGLIPEGAEAQL